MKPTRAANPDRPRRLIPSRGGASRFSFSPSTPAIAMTGSGLDFGLDFGFRSRDYLLATREKAVTALVIVSALVTVGGIVSFVVYIWLWSSWATSAVS
jgi:hypothetical protein